MHNARGIFGLSFFCCVYDYFVMLMAACVFVDPVQHSPTAGDAIIWTALPSLPDQEGFAGPFAGTHNGALLVAGGAKFPDKMPWQGGRKAWYNRVFVLESPEDHWKEAGALPRPLGYGVSVSTNKGVVCMGGSDATQHYADCFRLQWRDEKLSTIIMPSLPRPCSNFCGAILGDTVYVAGGLESPTANRALKTFWSLDLVDSSARWQELEPWPGPARMLATAAVQANTFFLCSGTDLKPGREGKAVREYLHDAYSYQPGRGWKRVSDMPRAAVAAPTPAPTLGQWTFLIMSGDDGTLIDFQPPEKHPGFPKSILAYDISTDIWRTVSDVPVGHVTTTMVPWRDCFVIPSGEIRPGRRSPAVWSLKE